IDKAISYAISIADDSKQKITEASDYLSVLIGKKLLTLIPGRVSTEIDARLSFDTNLMLVKARKLIELYEREGIDKSRVLIKIASTWEGIKAAEILEREGINCNLTLLFSFAQARACAEAGVFLISPFVGRILDWYKKTTGKTEYLAKEDPGVISVTAIYNYYKTHQYKTIVMGASFRNKDEILELAGCDRLTISPNLMQELTESNKVIERKLNAPTTFSKTNTSLDEATFRWQMNEDAMATEKTAEGIRAFAADQVLLEELLSTKF
ncbi:MAG: transaldolase, partial [Kangiellaceae bacterium]